MAGQMSQATRQSTAATGPVLGDAEREDGRDMARDDFTRVRPREQHERYEIAPSAMRKDMDYFWVATKIRGATNPRFADIMRAGWRPARAGDFPQHSGIDLKLGERMQEFLPAVKPDDPVIDNDLMLVMRPKSMSEESRDEDRKAADRQINDHLGRLQQTSRRAIGDRTQISRRTTRGAAPADMVPDEAELEE